MISPPKPSKTDQLVFVKTVKRNQDYRFDVPVFGLRTLEIMAENNIRTAVLKAAKAKIQVIGF
ncbi:UDP-2,3-diacylglucosamine diphosphatase LpxI [Akkermansiaceae bacterium]|nr:UDP-2,3-diacylglucosamine diphosphatase LpxI [Akkermansiaceae bacterium]MDB4748357.1 UDP-2,3-diacylglucosamine diphosphatase LpxI [Akkermansiaceae bacterium]